TTIEFPALTDRSGTRIVGQNKSGSGCPSIRFHAVNAIVTEGLNRDRIEPPQPPRFNFPLVSSFTSPPVARQAPVDGSGVGEGGARDRWPDLSLGGSLRRSLMGT